MVCMKSVPGNDINLGQVVGTDLPLIFSREARSTHLFVCGSTGTGKSKFLENMIRQDILNWRKSKCGLLLIDPHGSLYDGLMNWLAWKDLDRPIIPIDLRQGEWVVSYNVLRQRQAADPAVVVTNFIQAMAYVWGQGGTNNTPLFARWAENVLRVLYEGKHSLVEATYLIDRAAALIRTAMTAQMTNELSRQDWQLAGTLTPRDFDAQIGSTVSRFRPFLNNETLCSILGQTKVSLDLGKAIEDGAIILVNLSTEKARVTEEDSALLATLLLTDLWTAAKERGKEIDGQKVKPFYVYVDEFQNFVTPTIAKNLDQARGFGLHLTLANQFPQQILHAGAQGEQVYGSVMANARSKVVFETRGKENLEPLAFDLFMGTMDPDEVKHKLYSTKVLGYEEVVKEVRGESVTTAHGAGKQHGAATGAGLGGTQVLYNSEETLSASASESSFASESDSESESWSNAITNSKSYIPMLIPMLGQELSHVQFRSLDEQLHRAMAVLSDQQQRQGVARLVGMRAPATVFTPFVRRLPGKQDLIQRYLAKCYDKLPFAMRQADAQKELAERKRYFKEFFLKEMSGEPTTAKRLLAPKSAMETIKVEAGEPTTAKRRLPPKSGAKQK